MRRALRIAQVCPYGLSRFGGVRSHIRGLGEALMARGHAVTVIAPGDPRADPSGSASLGALPVVTCGSVHPVSFGGTYFDVAWATRAQCRAAIAHGFDVLHLHTPWNPVVPLQIAASFRGPRVATFHDVPGVDTPRWARALMPLGASLLRATVLHATIGVSPAVSTYLGAGTHVVIPNGVEPLDRAETDQTDARTPRRTRLLFIGRLEARKDVGTLLEALHLAATPLGADTPALDIIGDGPLRSVLEVQAERLALRNVRFLGAVDDATKWAALAAATCVVAPSRAGESFGIVLLEAMRAGSIPVAADNPGYRHVLEGDGRALLFAPGDAPQLADRLVRVVRDRAWRERMAHWCASRWTQFTWPRIAEAVEQVYFDAMTTAGARS
jgi:phosphatidylinositol alpha-mannosyltransferase